MPTTYDVLVTRARTLGTTLPGVRQPPVASPISWRWAPIEPTAG